MAKVSVRFGPGQGKIKPMHAVNNGPIDLKTEQIRSNFEAFRAARIPFVRNHDASFFIWYGGEHTVDVHAIFPDFTKNPYDADSYDFTLTDEYLKSIVDAGSSVFYRLGSKIEHWTKKYGTIVPSDFHKWAVVCEHIIRHYNEGWANGFRHNIVYWEIWNEPDGIKEDGTSPNWSGTHREFYELYAAAATHLKGRFPHLKIGGPAVCGYAEDGKWTKDFLAYLTAGGRRVPLDFFSWHAYTEYPCVIREMGEFTRALLDAAGYTETESILDEYNYLENFTDRFVSSVLEIIGMHGAALTAAAMAVGQAGPIDMLMYYDARPCIFNGMFDIYTLAPLKGYYPFVMFSRLYELGNAAGCVSDDEDIYAAAAGGDGGYALMLTHYRQDKAKVEKTVRLRLDGAPDGEWQAEVLDADRTMEGRTVTVKDGEAEIVMPADCVVLLRR
jgi:hypothetical protein